jgi:hypothetical protein
MTNHALTDIRKQVNISLWMVTVRRRLAEERDPATRRLLAGMLIELNNRLPERANAPSCP